MAVLVRCSTCNLSLDVSRQPPGAVLSCRCGSRVEVPRTEATAGMLKCPNCGAPASAGSRECSHCRAGLKTLRCPSCFGFGFVGNRHCPTCGHSLSALPSGEALDIECPRCRRGLTGRTFGSVPVATCEECNGLWLDHGAFEDVKLSDRPRTARPSEASQFVPPPQPAGAAVYVPCPVCRKVMNRVNFGRRSGIIIDMCRDDGVWFDAEELTAVLKFIDSGGLERAREAESKRREAELRSMIATASAAPVGWSAPASRSLAAAPAARLLIEGVVRLWSAFK